MPHGFAIFPGSFDPPTYGHLNIIERASRIFEQVDVLVSINAQKKYLFSGEERFNLMKKYCTPYSNVRIVSWHGLIVEYAREHDIHVIIRGLRPLSDFAYEFELAALNYQINNEVETIFMPTATKYSVLRSSSLKEMAALGVNLDAMAPAEVLAKLREKLLGKRS